MINLVLSTGESAAAAQDLIAATKKDMSAGREFALAVVNGVVTKQC